MTKPFENNTEYLQFGLSWIDLLVRSEVVRFRQGSDAQSEALKGMYISDEDVDRLLVAEREVHKETEELGARAAQLAEEIDVRARASLASGIPLAVPHVMRRFGLTRFEQQLLLLALAPELEPKYERLFGYLHDDLSRRRATVGLALRLLCRSQAERLAVLPVFTSAGALLHSGLMSLSSRADETLPQRSLVLDDLTLNFLMGQSHAGSDLQACLEIVTNFAALEELRWDSDWKISLVRFVRESLEKASASRRRVVLHLQGPEGTGKKALAGALCGVVGLPMLVADVAELTQRFADPEPAFRSVFRYGRMFPAAMYLEHFDAMSGDDAKNCSQRRIVTSCIRESSWLSFVATENAWHAGNLFSQDRFVSIELPIPDSGQRKILWERAARQVELEPDVDWSDVATKFRLSPGRIETAMHAAASLACLRSGESASVRRSDLYEACQAQSNRKLGTLAQRVSTRSNLAGPCVARPCPRPTTGNQQPAQIPPANLPGLGIREKAVSREGSLRAVLRTKWRRQNHGSRGSGW